MLRKKAVHFDRDVFANVIPVCLVLIFTSKTEFANCISSYDLDCVRIWQIMRVYINIYFWLLLTHLLR